MHPFPVLSCCLFLAALAPRQSETAVGGVTASLVSSCGMGKEPRALGVVPGTLSPGGNPRHSDQSLVGAGPGGILAALRYMSSSLSHEVPWGAQGNLWPSPDKLMRRVLSEERGGCCSPRPGCGYSRATRRGTSHPLNCRRFQPSQSTDPHQPAFALGSPVGVGIEGLAGEVESSCSHPREAMNLVHVRRISRRKPNCKQVPTCGIHALRT